MQFGDCIFSRKSVGAYALFFALLTVGCVEQNEPVSQLPRQAPAEQDKENATDSLSIPETTGPSAAGRTHTGMGNQILAAVRIGKQPEMDRLVFEFNDDGLPEWEVKYVDPSSLVQCGSGDPVSIAGDARLQITFRGAQAHTDVGDPTAGPYRRNPAQAALLELVRTCDFEGEVAWIAGTVRESKYTTSVLAEPSRLVIDIAH